MNVGSIVPRGAVDGEVVVFGMHKKEQVTKEEHDRQDYTIKELQDWWVGQRGNNVEHDYTIKEL